MQSKLHVLYMYTWSDLPEQYHVYNRVQEEYKKRPAHAEINISERNRRKESIIVQP